MSSERVRAADDFSFIGKRLRRNRVMEMCHRASFTSGLIPEDIMFAAGFTPDDLIKIPQHQRTMPLNDSDLL